jgi:hypothetical protein
VPLAERATLSLARPGGLYAAIAEAGRYQCGEVAAGPPAATGAVAAERMAVLSQAGEGVDPDRFHATSVEPGRLTTRYCISAAINEKGRLSRAILILRICTYCMLLGEEGVWSMNPGNTG